MERKQGLFLGLDTPDRWLLIGHLTTAIAGLCFALGAAFRLATEGRLATSEQRTMTPITAGSAGQRSSYFDT